MNPILNLSNDEKEKIRNWKQSLPVNKDRQFIYAFIENGKFDDEGYMYHNYIIKSNDKFQIVVAENVQIY